MRRGLRGSSAGRELEWGLQADGTDLCVEEWLVTSDCMEALTCDEQRRFFRPDISATDYPCKEELDARQDCFESRPSLDNPDGGQ